MGFLERFKAKGRGNGGVADADVVSVRRDRLVPHGAARAIVERQHGAARHAMPQHGDARRSARLDHLGGRAVGDWRPTSTRRACRATPAPAPLAAALPLIGNKPVAEQQRILLACVGCWACSAWCSARCSRCARPAAAPAQVAAVGQALMQSQRLAKSVTQALVGSAAGVPGSADSADGAGRATCAACSSGEGERRRSSGQRAGHASSRCCRWSTAPRRTPTTCWASRRR